MAQRLVLLSIMIGAVAALRFQTIGTRGEAASSSDLIQPPPPGTCHLKHQPHQEHESFENYDHGSSYQGLYVNPEKKFAFCTIEKNACSQWTALMKKLESGNLMHDGPAYGITHKSFTAEKAESVFNDSTAIRAVFLRDPIERFLSAFLDKCFDQQCANPFCEPRPEIMEGQPISLKLATQWFLNRNLSTVDGHWKPQSMHCELDKRLHEYTHVGVMTEATLAQEATCLLDEASLTHLNIRKSDVPGETLKFWDVKSRNAFSRNVGSEDQTTEYLKKFFTKHAARALYKKLESDYQALSLPKPEWIEHASGELYDTTKTSGVQCKGEAPHHKEVSFIQRLEKIDVLEKVEEWGEMDSIVALAHQHGFPRL